MSRPDHLFYVGQDVRILLDSIFYDGRITETSEDHILVDVPDFSDHCRFDADMLSMVYPAYNFT